MKSILSRLAALLALGMVMLYSASVAGVNVRSSAEPGAGTSSDNAVRRVSVRLGWRQCQHRSVGPVTGWLPQCR